MFCFHSTRAESLFPLFMLHYICLSQPLPIFQSHMATKQPMSLPICPYCATQLEFCYFSSIFVCVRHETLNSWKQHWYIWLYNYFNLKYCGDSG